MTGATGFVGRQILRSLEDAGVPVRLVVRNLRTPSPDVVTTPDLFAEDAAWWAETMEGVDTVVHAAWYAEPGMYLHSPLNLHCLSGTLAMAQGAIAAGVRRFVGVGTCFEYDLSAGDLDLNTPLRPITPYAGAKAAAFLALSQILPASGVEFAWCRLFYLYGEGEDPRRFVPYLNDRLSRGEAAELTSGVQVRDFLDVAVAGRVIASVAGGDIQGPVNVCSGRPVTLRRMAEAIADRHGRRDLLRFGTRPDNAVDPVRVVGAPTFPVPESPEPW
ncbi:NAD-dependent epimerase/dehydratase family protein [Brevundimonas sp. SL161]|uniref:NAD-dependent epimerase/dehydratase family protein n=1 Tax=Brevundimonas sp. SL161 TaxID=2804613 RepID=UPI003CE847E2